MSRLSEVLTIAVLLLVLLQVYLHHIDTSSTGLQLPDIENSVPTQHEQLIITLNATLHALRSELGGVVSLHKQVAAHALEEAKSGKAISTVAEKAKLDAEREKTSLSIDNISLKPKDADSNPDMMVPQIKTGLRHNQNINSDSHSIIKDNSVNKVNSEAIRTNRKPRRALIFTMDSITTYENESRRGGAAGEIRVRESLQHALQQFGVNVRTVRSDEEFDTCQAADYDYLIVDPWTWAAKGWVPKPTLRGQEHKVYILDFFGSPKLKGNSFNIPPDRFLTAFGSQWNQMLGYSMSAPVQPIDFVKKNQQGVLWGKDPKHFQGKEGMLQAVAGELSESYPEMKLVSTSSQPIPLLKRGGPNIVWQGHQSPKQWMDLLHQSKFLVGLGDPLLGPSALDAIAAGCMYINPIFTHNVKGSLSQHPYASKAVGEPYVCNYKAGDAVGLMQCIKKALTVELKPMVPAEFTPEAYLQRVQRIFDL